MTRRWTQRAGLMTVIALLTILTAGCAVRIIPPYEVTVYSVGDGAPRRIVYPAEVIVHDDHAFFDLHNIKSNLFGLTDLELVRLADLAADFPDRDVRPFRTSIDWIRHQFARLPDCAATRIVGGFFWALGADRYSYGRDQLFLPRFIYLTNWAQMSLGELNRVAGYAVPYQETLIPRAWTHPLNAAVDWGQTRAIGLYLYVLQTGNEYLEWGITGIEECAKVAVWLAVAPWMKPLPAEFIAGVTHYPGLSDPVTASAPAEIPRGLSAAAGGFPDVSLLSNAATEADDMP